jgi:broad specificity phosphatase PhoE
MEQKTAHKQSYLDLAVRLEPVILELERCRDDVLIVAHESVLRCLYAYFVDFSEEVRPFRPFLISLLTCDMLILWVDQKEGYTVHRDSEACGHRGDSEGVWVRADHASRAVAVI